MQSLNAMAPILLLGLGLTLGDGGGPSPPPSTEEDAYRAATRAAGRDADAQVRLALWCEAQGQHADALRHLALAVLVAPDHPTARGLLGQVRRGQAWARPEQVAGLPDADPARAALREEYEGRRARMGQAAEDHWKLALWCERSGLPDEAAAHFAAVTRLDPGREAAWRRLGYRKVDGRWTTDARLAAERAEADARADAEATWRPRVESWAEQLADPDARGAAIAGLSAVEDPLLVPLVWSTLVAGRHADQAVAVQVLGQIDARDASRALATLAAFSADAQVRRLATETLKRRDAREWADLLIGMIRKPIRYSVRPVAGPGSQGELFVEGERYNRRRIYATPALPQFQGLPGDQVVAGPDGLPVIQRQYQYTDPLPFWWDPALLSPLQTPDPGDRAAFIGRLEGLGLDRELVASAIRNRDASSAGVGQPLPTLNVGRVPGAPPGDFVTGMRSVEIPIGRAVVEAQRAAATVEEQFRRDVAAIEAYNTPINQVNGWVVPVLEEATGERKGVEPEAWRAWYVDQIGLRQVMPRPGDGASTLTDVVTAQPREVPIGIVDRPSAVLRVSHSCFGKGTLVRTDHGPRPIEELQVGDLVLSQDTTTGSLAYRPIVAVHHNPPSTTFDVRIGGETVVSSEFHRFWVAGRGWVMARDLKAGDAIRTLGRTAEIEAIEDGQVQPVYNLEVADTRSFFVGTLGALVHDNSLPSTTIEPFDAVPELAAVASAGDDEAGPDRPEGSE